MRGATSDASPAELQREAPIRIALAIVDLFAGGGLQRDCLAVARRLVGQGHEVVVFCAACEDGFEDLRVEVLPNRARTNHGRNAHFAQDLARATAGRFDRVAGFNKLSGLDVLYCADPPIRGHRSLLARMTPRYRTLVGLEGACFAPKAATRLILLAEGQRLAYARSWHTQPERMLLLPPTIDRRRVQPQLRADGTRQRTREALGLGGTDWVWLHIGGFPKTKGLDRLLAALHDFPEARVLCVGLASTDRRAQAPIRLARQQGVADQVRWLGMRDDIPALMAAADVLVHPARLDTTGTVILEAVANGLPVVTTAVCGYAPHVTAAKAGLVLDEPFRQQHLVAALTTARQPDLAAQWSANAARYGREVDLYAGLDRAATIIAEAGASRG